MTPRSQGEGSTFEHGLGYSPGPVYTHTCLRGSDHCPTATETVLVARITEQRVSREGGKAVALQALDTTPTHHRTHRDGWAL